MEKNLSIVNDWLKGDNMRPLSINFVTDASDLEKKKTKMEVGEKYSDADGKEWEKTSYGWASVPKVINAIHASAPHCTGCNKEIEINSKDDKTYGQTKLCFECTIDMDMKRKLDGSYKNFEQIFIFKKQRDYVTNMIAELEEGLESLGKKEAIEFINEFGDREQWSGLDVVKIKTEMTSDISDGKEALIRINEQLEKLNG